MTKCNLCGEEYTGLAQDCRCTGWGAPPRCAPMKMGLGRLWLCIVLLAVIGLLALFGCTPSSNTFTEPDIPQATPWVARYASHTEVVCTDGLACATYSIALELYDGSCFYDVAIEAHPGTAWVSFESDVCTYTVNDSTVFIRAHGISYGQDAGGGGPREQELWAQHYFEAVDSNWSGLWREVRQGEPPILLERI